MDNHSVMQIPLSEVSHIAKSQLTRFHCTKTSGFCTIGFVHHVFEKCLGFFQALFSHVFPDSTWFLVLFCSSFWTFCWGPWMYRTSKRIWKRLDWMVVFEVLPWCHPVISMNEGQVFYGCLTHRERFPAEVVNDLSESISQEMINSAPTRRVLLPRRTVRERGNVAKLGRPIWRGWGIEKQLAKRREYRVHAQTVVAEAIERIQAVIDLNDVNDRSAHAILRAENALAKNRVAWGTPY